jgi:malate dehydrogenase (oxaloacetate-decarboxylating)
VARGASAIQRDPSRAFGLTGLGNSVGIFTNGTRVLGLGNIGPIAALPVMEGKAVLYDQFVGISAVPILVDTTDPKKFIETVLTVSRSFGGIHLEDIRIPECFEIEAELDRLVDKPVMHDDQHGTATVALAGIMNACGLVGLDLKKARMGQVGLGAAGSSIAKLALAYGVGEVLVTDPNPDAMRPVLERGARPSDFETIMREADIVVLTTGKPGLITPALVRKGQVIFALSNPLPEITPERARAAGAAFAADGQSVNNALAYPGIFKGALEVRSRAITPGMMIAAAEAIAAHAVRGEVVPSPLLPEVHRAVTRAVAERARAEGLSATMRL